MGYLIRRLSQPAEQTAEPSLVACGRKGLQDLGENDGNVVITAIILRGLHQVVNGEWQIGLERVDDQGDVGILHQIIEAIRAEQIDVVGISFVLSQMGGYAWFNA